MAGIDRQTGRVIEPLGSTLQSVEVILGTQLGSRCMRREFGGGVLELLGRGMKPSLFAAWRQLVATAIDLWEPRLRIRRVSLEGTVDDLRVGRAKLVMEADFRPRAHLGDLAVERRVSLSLQFLRTGLQVTA